MKMFNKYNLISRHITSIISMVAFVVSMITPVQMSHAQGVLNMPSPGTIVTVSPAYTPVLMKGVTLDLKNPFSFDFIVHPGDTGLQGEQLRLFRQLVKFFHFPNKF